MRATEIRQRELFNELNNLKQTFVLVDSQKLLEEITHIIHELEETKVSTADDIARQWSLIYLLYPITSSLPANVSGSISDRMDLHIRCGKIATKCTLVEEQIYAQGWLAYLERSHNNRFKTSGDIGGLDLSIEYQRLWIQLASDDHPHMAAQLYSLGYKYRTRFNRLGRSQDIEKGINSLEKAVALASSDPSQDLSNWFDTLGIAYMTRFERLGKVEDINKAIELQDRIVSAAAEGHPDLPSWCSNLGSSFLTRFESLGRKGDLDDALQYYARAISLISGREDSPDLPDFLNNLGNTYIIQFENFGQQEDITRAIENQARAVALSPQNHPNYAMYLMNLGASYLTRFEHIGNPLDIERAIELQNKALSLTPKGHPSIPGTLSNLGNCYSTRFERLGKLEDIDNAIKHLTGAIRLTDNDDPSRSVWLNNLGASYSHRFGHLENLEDLERDIDSRRQALLLTPEGHPGMPSVLINLGSSYRIRFKRLGNDADINKAIEHLARGVFLLPAGHPELQYGLHSLGNSYMNLFEITGDLEHITKAIDSFNQAILITSREHILMPGILSSLGLSYISRFEHSGHVDDLEKAMTYHTEAVLLAPIGHPSLPEWLTHLSSAYAYRFRYHRNPKDIDQAIEHQSQVIALTPRNSASRHERLMNLGSWYGLRFNHLGRLEDIDKAIDLQTQAISITPRNHSNTAMWLGNLGLSYATRFSRLREAKDVDRAIEHQLQAVTLTPEGHTGLPGRLNNLATSFNYRFSSSGVVGDLNTAIGHQQRALSYFPDGHADTHGVLSNLAGYYLRRFEFVKEIADLNKSVELLSRALSITPEDHGYKSSSLARLASSLCHRFLVMGQPQDIDDAIDHLVVSLSKTHEDDLYSPSRLRKLGNAYKHRFYNIRDPTSLENALEYLRKASQSRAASPREKFSAACDWIDLSSRHATHEHLQACQVAMDLVPEIVWIGSTVAQRYNYVPDVGKIASQATAAAIQASRYSLAVEWLEQGRSIIWNQILQLRDPLDELRIIDPVLADQLAQVAGDLQDSGSSVSDFVVISDNQVSLEQTAQKRRRLAEDYITLLGQVRQKSGFENFLRPKRFPDLLPAARNGPVVLINVYQSRCDALVLQPGQNGVVNVPLPNISYESITELHNRTERLLGSMDLRARKIYRRPAMPELEEEPQDLEFARILSAIWRDVTKPVLDTLGYKPASSIDHIPHITWCATGPLSFLPIHAAGIYGQSGTKVYEYAISSYTPTLSAMLPATSSTHAACSILGVGQEDTPGQTLLPQTTNELAFISTHAQTPILYSQLLSSNATTTATLGAMEKHDWVHLACHAHQNASEPTESGFFLHNGILSLAMITGRHFKGKGLAFLSACQTATGDKKLADESVHLASGMLMAGYPSVIGTAWSIVDSDAPLIADAVYSCLIKDGKMDHKEAAKALHIAVGKLREHVGETTFWRWAPYIHIGS